MGEPVTPTSIHVLHDGEHVTFRTQAKKKRKFSKVERQLVLTDRQLLISNMKGSVKDAIRLSASLTVAQKSPREIGITTKDGEEVALEVPNAATWCRALSRALDKLEEESLEEMEGLRDRRKSRNILPNSVKEYNRRSREMKHSSINIEHQFTLLKSLTVETSGFGSAASSTHKEKQVLDKYFKRKHKQRRKGKKSCAIM
jgi:hypothetical protein